MYLMLYYIENTTPHSINIDEEHSCQMSSQSDLKWLNLRVFKESRIAPTRRRRTTTRL